MLLMDEEGDHYCSKKTDILCDDCCCQDLELKKKVEEEKAKEMEASVTDEKGAVVENKEPVLELLKVKERLEALKEMAVETRRRPFDTANKSLCGS